MSASFMQRLVLLGFLASALAPTPAAASVSSRALVVGAGSGRVARALRRSGKLEAVHLWRAKRVRGRRGRARWAALARKFDARWVVAIRRVRVRRGRKWRRYRATRVAVRNAQGNHLAARTFYRRPSRRVARWLLKLLPRSANTNATTDQVTLPSKQATPSRPIATIAPVALPKWAAIRTTSRPGGRTTRPVPAEAQGAIAPAETGGSDVPLFEDNPNADTKVASLTGDSVASNTIQPASAQRMTGPLMLRRAQRTLPFKLSGAVWARHMSYLLDRDAGKVNSRNEVAINLVLGARIGTAARYARALVDGVARADLSDDSRTDAFFSEAYVEAGWGPLIFSAGSQLLGWGSTDLFSPVDVLKQSDFRDPLDREDRGAFLLRSKLLIGKHLFVEGVWTPIYQPGLQPAPDALDEGGQLRSSSRWFVAPTLPVVEPPADLADGPDSFQYAGRVGLTSDWIDIAACYVYGYLPLPHFTEEPPMTTRGRYHRYHGFGLELQTTIRQLVIKGESLLTMTSDTGGNDELVPDAFISYVGQLEYTAKFSRSDHELRLSALYLGEHGLQGQEIPLDVLHPFRQVVALQAEWTLFQDTVLTATGLYDIPDGYAVRATAKHELVDGLSAELGGLYMGGEESSLFGLFRRNHRVYLELKYAF